MTTRVTRRAGLAAAMITIGLLAGAGPAMAATGDSADSVRITGADNRDFGIDGVRVTDTADDFTPPYQN